MRILTLSSGSSEWQQVANPITRRDGRFSARLPKGPSRRVRVTYCGRDGGHYRDLRLRAKPSVGLRANRRRVRNGRSVVFTGRVRSRPIPTGGKLVELQAFFRGRWRTFQTLHTKRRGTFRFRYWFGGTQGTVRYRFRAVAPREGGYPYTTGSSRRVDGDRQRLTSRRMPDGTQPVFYYDFNSPYAWLAAERVNHVLPQPAGVAAHLVQPRPQARPAAALVAHRRARRGHRGDRAAGEASAGCRTLRWPEGWPANTVPMAGLRAATFAADIGKSVSFSLAAFRQTFLAARPMNELDNVLLAGAACELHPNAIKAALERESIKQKLTENTNEAIERGVEGVPTVAVGDELFWGDDRLEDAAHAARAAS